MRHELIPLLDAIAERDVAAVLARQADTARAEAAFLDELAREIQATDARALAAAPAVLARRAIRLWLRAAGGPERHPPDAAAVERDLIVARGEAVACQLAGGWRVSRSRNRLTLDPPARSPA